MKSGLISGFRLAGMLGDWRGGGPAYRDLAGAVAERIVDGRLPLAARLPAERDLAAALHLSRTTISAAYEQLRAGGYLRSRRGSGSVTALPGRGRTVEPWTLRPATDGLLDLAVAALPPPDRLPELAAAAAADLAGLATSTGYDAGGLPALRAAVAERLTGRGLPTTAEQVLISAGAQHGFTLLLRLLVRPGDRVLVECPSYPNALAAITAAGARPVPVGLGPADWDVSLFADTLREAAPVATYLMPDYQNPTGRVMAAEDRARLVAAVRRSGSVLVVDESFVDLPLDGQPLPAPTGSHDPGESVVTVGSMSKGWWGGLRIGWIRAAVPIIRRLADVRAIVDMTAPALEQLLALRLLAAGDELVEAQRVRLRTRRAALTGALADLLPDWTFTPPAGGICLWVDVGAPTATAVAAAAERRGVLAVPGPRFGSAAALERYLRLPFALEPADLVEAVARLARGAAEADRYRGGTTNYRIA